MGTLLSPTTELVEHSSPIHTTRATHTHTHTHMLARFVPRIATATRALSARAVPRVSTTSVHASLLRPAFVAPSRYMGGAADSAYLSSDVVKDRVLEVVRNFPKVDPDKVSDAAHFTKDLGLDSLDTVELVMAFEDEFFIEISDAEFEKIHTTSDAIEYISSHPNAK